MTQEEKRIKIAEACGWVDLKSQWHGYHMWKRPTGETNYGTKSDKNACLPDYFNDLNACHEMEESMTWEQGSQFNELLCDILPPDQHIYHATAEQRAEAFGKTINLW